MYIASERKHYVYEWNNKEKADSDFNSLKNFESVDQNHELHDFEL